MVRMGDKKGSHVGVVISFIIFVMFILFLYSIAQPSFKEEQNEEALMVYLENKMMANTTSTLTVITVNVSNTGGQNCIQLNELSNNFGLLNRIYAWDDEQVSTPSGVHQNNVRINRLNNDDTFFKIYYSEHFYLSGDSSGWACDNLDENTGYTLGATKYEKYVFESIISDLIDDYYINYEKLKTDLEIPRSFEFGFGLVFSNGTITETPTPSALKNVYVRDIPIQYVSDRGEIESGFLKLKSW
jgi:hypothetical protein